MPASANTASFATSAVRGAVCALGHMRLLSTANTMMSPTGTGCGVIPCEQCAAFGTVATRVCPPFLSFTVDRTASCLYRRLLRLCKKNCNVPKLHQALLH